MAAGAGAGGAESTFVAARVHEFGGPDVLRLDSGLPVPVPKPGSVLVRMAYAGVNPVDTYVRAGTYANKPALPFVPGNDGSGVVETVGDGVTDLEVGDRVYIYQSDSGTYAQYSECQARFVFKLPDNVSLKTGAAVGIPAFTAHRALTVATNARPGEWVMIHGASGAVGIAAVQLAVDMGCRVIGTAGSQAGMRLVQGAGAEVVLNHHDDALGDQVLAATAGAGVNVIIEMLANVNLGKDLPLLALRGRVGVVGSRGDVTITPRDLMAREAAVVGVMRGFADADPAYLAEAEAYIRAKLASGALAPAVGAEYPLAEAAAAQIEVIEHSHGSSGKIVLNCWGDRE